DGAVHRSGPTGGPPGSLGVAGRGAAALRAEPVPLGPGGTGPVRLSDLHGTPDPGGPGLALDVVRGDLGGERRPIPAAGLRARRGHVPVRGGRAGPGRPDLSGDP